MIDDHLTIFNRDGIEYRKLVFDPDRSEADPVTNVNDINRGALHNMVEWHRRVGQRHGANASLTDATGALIDAWADFFAIDRPAGMSDVAFRSYILGTVLAVAVTNPVIQGIFVGEVLRESNALGPYFDNSYLGVGAHRDGVQGCVLTHTTNALYVIFADLASYDPSLATAAQLVKAAGIGLYQGIEP